MVTIKEIAELAGVSRGTVDRVINKRGNVNPKTEEKVMKILETLDYKPNRAGLALAVTKKNLVIGVLLFGEQNLFFDDIIAGINGRLAELGSYGITLIWKRTGFSAEEQSNAISELLAEHISGLILTPFDDPLIEERVNELMGVDIPVVTVNTDIKNASRIAYIGSDYHLAGCTAAGLMNMMTQGNVSIGIITGSKQVLCHEERIHGFLETIDASYPRIQLTEIAENHDDEIESYKVTTALLEKYPDINALFFTGAGVYGGCKSVIEQKKQIKIITFDTLPTTLELLKQHIIQVTIGQQPYQQGYDSLSVLFEYLLSHQIPEIQCHYIPSNIIIRENADFL